MSADAVANVGLRTPSEAPKRRSRPTLPVLAHSGLFERPRLTSTTIGKADLPILFEYTT
jgi:hypothetical protein